VGFQTREETFTYSQFPARWAPSILTLVLALTGLAVGHAAVVTHKTLPGVAAAVVVLILVAIVARYLARAGVLDFPLSRSTSTNVVATRSNRLPSLWLVAHVDSKSQTIPMLLRIAAVGLFTLSLAMILVAGAAMTVVHADHVQHALADAAHLASVVLMASALPLVLCFIGNRSNGALDNATGVAAVLLAARDSSSENFGVIITSAEELGLAGAHAFARANRDQATAVNCDTIDDNGRFLLMRSKAPSSYVQEAVARAADRAGIPTGGFRRMLPGVLADNVAFSAAGWDSFTIARGNLRTLSRVHTSGDRADSIDGTGIAQAALLIAAIVEELS
jgi:hypothetical protein